jgi:uncharacterized protein (TIGR00299 family) protein
VVKVAYFDCFSGISGDMVLGALLDLGLPLDDLLKELARLPLKDFRLEVNKVERKGIAATQVVVQSYEEGVVRYWSNIQSLIQEGKLESTVKKDSYRIFETLASAEAAVHGRNRDQIHFHEIGAVDSIIDIVGAAFGIHHLGIEKIYASPLPTGRGTVHTEHGVYPVPAPATLEILKGVPLYGTDTEAELVTPTGAAIISTLAQSFGPIPPMRVGSVGYGAGFRNLDTPNVLRVLVGEEESAGVEEEAAVLLSTNIDDLNPELFDYVTGKLLEAGALDVWLHPIQMKKNRPGVTLNVLCHQELVGSLSEIIFTETSTLGIRVERIERKKMRRKTIEIEIPQGKVRVKLGYLGDAIVSVAPEYEDCATLARQSGAPIKEIFALAEEKAREKLRGEL